MSGDPQPKSGKRTRKRKGGRARPDEPLAAVCHTYTTFPKVCTGRPECRHHLLRRSQGGSDAAENTVDLCNACHAHIHREVGESYRLGLLRRSQTFNPETDVSTYERTNEQ